MGCDYHVSLILLANLDEIPHWFRKWNHGFQLFRFIEEVIQIIVAFTCMIEDFFCFIDKFLVRIGLTIDYKLIGAD